jgi:chloramphenicol O-acetyltransferase type A
MFMGHAIDLKTWKRRAHYEHFRDYRQPFFSVCVNLDATRLWRRTRAGGPPFFLSSLFLMLSAVNATEAFRLRLRRRGVWRHDRIAVGPTLLRPDHTFAFARLEPAGTLKKFIASGSRAIARSERGDPLSWSPGGDDIVYQSSLPWLRFTSFTNAIDSGDSIPRIAFGKCSQDGRRFLMPMADEVHHAVVDGLDVARFTERFQDSLAEFSW